MSVAFSETFSLTDAAGPAAAGGRVVLSRLPRGETVIGRSSLSLKVVLKGEERYVIDGRVTRLVAGHALLVDPGETTRVILPGEQSLGLCFHFPETRTNSVLERVDLAPAVLPLVDHPLGSWLNRVARGLDRRPDFGRAAAGALLARTAAHLEDFVSRAGERADRIGAEKRWKRIELLRRVEVARDFLHATPNRIVALEELAGVAGLSAFHLARCFKAVHDVPPATYHRNWRLDRAAVELKRGRDPAAELAAGHGFADQASFIRAFARRHGVSPGRYRAGS
jgi:AraC-like DNA-binding protein